MRDALEGTELVVEFRFVRLIPVYLLGQKTVSKRKLH